MKKILTEFKDLTPQQLYSLLKLRQDVFIIEQNCIYNDLDGYDEQALHLLFVIEKELAAYSRIFPPNIKYEGESSIGRIIVAKNHRGGPLGRQLINESIQYCLSSNPTFPIRIEAQAALETYYYNLGFVSDSEVYKVDGIDHLQMIYVKN